MYSVLTQSGVQLNVVSLSSSQSTKDKVASSTRSPYGNGEVMKVCQVVLRQQRVRRVDTCQIRVGQHSRYGLTKGVICGISGKNLPRAPDKRVPGGVLSRRYHARRSTRDPNGRK